MGLKMKVLIDTNALIYAAENKADIFSQIDKPVVPTAVLSELKSIASDRENKSHKAAKLAAELASKAETIDLGKGYTDDLIFEHCKAKGVAVLTNDALLRSRCKKAGIKTFYIRLKKLVAED